VAAGSARIPQTKRVLEMWLDLNVQVCKGLEKQQRREILEEAIKRKLSSNFIILVGLQGIAWNLKISSSATKFGNQN
jgi:hypothetical protein